MSDLNDWNSKIIAEFRENEGRVGGQFAGATILLLHTTGAKSGVERINPAVYRQEGDRTYVFASKAGADTNPDWYYNLVAHPEITVELGAESFSATASTLDEEERSEVFSRQAAQSSGFADYQAKTSRVIPVVEIKRTA